MAKIALELHRHGQPEPTDLLPYAGDVAYTNAVTGVSTCSITLRWPFAQWPTPGVPPVIPGDWVVVRDAESGEAAWFGRVDRVSGGRTVGQTSGPAHEIKTSPTIVSATSFQTMLRKSRQLLAPGMKIRVPGGIYQFRSWGPVLTAWMSAFRAETPGDLLSQAFTEMAKQRLPDSLGGETLGDAIVVAWDRDLAPPILKGRMTEVPGLALQAFANIVPSGNLWSMIEGAFGADAALTEFYSAPYSGKPETALEKALGCQYPLVYRMAPKHPSLPPTGPGVATTGRFQEGAGYDFPYVFSDNDVLDWNFALSDDDRVNGFSTHALLQPRSQLGVYGIVGTPIVQPADAENHGLRFREASWPFFPSSDDEVVGGRKTLASEIDSLNEYSAHVLQDGHLKMSGALKVRPRRSLKPGVWALADLKGPLLFSCYITGVTHRINAQAETGVITERTSITFVRGEFGVFKKPTPIRPIPSDSGAVDSIDLGALGGVA